MLICVVGGILGVLFIILFCCVMVVNSDLFYFEGVVVVEIFKVGNYGEGDSGVKDIVYGGIFVVMVVFFINGLCIVVDGVSVWVSSGKVMF